MFVKICGITNEEDALLAVAMGADAVAFNFVPGSSRRIAAAQVHDITRRLPPEVMTVGVFRDEAPQRVGTEGHREQGVLLVGDAADLDEHRDRGYRTPSGDPRTFAP